MSARTCTTVCLSTHSAKQTKKNGDRLPRILKLSDEWRRVVSFNLRLLDPQQHYIERRVFPRAAWSLWQRNKDPSLPGVESLSSPELAVIPILLCCYLICPSPCYKLLFVLNTDCIKTFNEGSS